MGQQQPQGNLYLTMRGTPTASVVLSQAGKVVASGTLTGGQIASFYIPALSTQVDISDSGGNYRYSGSASFHSTGVSDAVASLDVTLSPSTGMPSPNIRTTIEFEVECPEPVQATVTLQPMNPSEGHFTTTVTIPGPQVRASGTQGLTVLQLPSTGYYLVNLSAQGYQPLATTIYIQSSYPYVLNELLLPSAPAPGTTETVLLQPVSSADGSNVPNFQLWVEGKQQTVTSGAVPVQVPVTGEVSVSVKAANFSSYTGTVASSSPTTKTVLLKMDPLPTPDTVFLFSSGQPIPGVTVQAVTFGTTFTGVTDATGKAVIPNIPARSYDFSATCQGFQPLSKVLEIGTERSFSFTLIALPSATPTPVAPSDLRFEPVDAMPSLDVAEEIYDTYDNSAYQGYFTAAQCQAYIGDLFLDELVVLQYALQQNAVPVFGYCSEFLDGYGRGRSIVQGQIVLNYVHQGYLYAALSRYGKYNMGEITNEDHATKLMRTLQATTSPKVSPDLQKQAQVKLAQLLKTSSPADIQTANYMLRAARNPLDNFANPLYLHQVFDIRLVVGDGPFQSVRTLEKVKLGANEQIIDIRSGEVVAESYAFTARRLR